ncbi:peptidoglycan DD-metalloendopeptidase family protein [Nodularia spumigena CS-584]|jgi:murein DD-endopeptidase MepM/ murein hydrolase activator NlpD|uniref:Murein DD-endopeptidase MepM n=2 Tax=Nodularia spumigena TaxID=70799 RepID=A0A2S0QAD4_NODSP|nr:peptidoglycan DD-metalloendopeptidase family protein [Nodularia spumigena]AVZ31324.1 murein DD-endopeptidase MepM [Nodularia spumigena UHCC 0039]EAW44955.1 Peptidase M23B [Nodularia spumigena CCY9414]MDB9384619.1 peptidoglycan DD-metalloendopeptidase family protein [Nodularia spumigena CS-584]MEA5524459.1 peptidoglycan DD-metalloendopeptidase family protein [Nodularia spumigena UHCC 0143]MEA5555901.1 peptidoglycan DD-metalloendopeptidase family protein [Nodularia spumigena CH309]
MRSLFFPQTKLFWLCLALCCVLCFGLGWLPGSANTPSSIDTLKQQQQQINKEREKTIQQRDRLTDLQEAAENRLTGLNQNLQTTNTHIQDSELRLRLATENLEALEAVLLVTESDYEKSRTATVARLRYLQRSPASQGLAVLLQSQNISDFIRRRRQLKLVYQADQKILAQLNAQANSINEQKTAVAQQKNEIALIRQQLLLQKADYQLQAESQSELVERLNSDRLALEAAQNQLDRDSKNISVLIQNKVAQAQAKANSRSNILIRGSGILAFPSNARTSSAFGWRIHPILGYRRFHSGLDFAASYGSKIRAADSGNVIFAGWYGGYGRTVIIDHGQDKTTLYAHASELYVSEGQSVERGQAIASVGSTGLSTGPHLHFEVRRNGTPVNPADYL